MQRLSRTEGQACPPNSAPNKLEAGRMLQHPTHGTTGLRDQRGYPSEIYTNVTSFASYQG
jgi:hypothetical protein